MPTLDEINEPVPGPAPELGVLRHNAQWANTFDNPTDQRPVNLAMRARNFSDKDAYASALVDERARQTRQAIQTDKTRQALFFKTENLKMAQDKAKFDMGLAQKKFDSSEALVPFKKDAEIARTAAALALERARIETAKHKAELELAQHGDTAGFAAGMSGLKPGTPEFMQAAAELRTAFPAVDKSYFDDIWKMTGDKLTFDERQERAKETAASVGFVPKSVTGSGVAYGSPEKPKTDTAKDPELTALKAHLAQAVVGQTAANADEKPKWDNQIAAFRAEIAKREGTAPAPSSPTQSAFKEGEVRSYRGASYKRDAAGVWHLQP